MKTDTIIAQAFDKDGNLLYEKDADGYEERNDYDSHGNLIRSEILYPNGLREVEHFGSISQ